MNAFTLCEPLPDTVLRGFVQQIKARKSTGAPLHTDNSIDRLAALCSSRTLILRAQLDTISTSDTSVFGAVLDYLGAVDAVRQEFANEAHSVRADAEWDALLARLSVHGYTKRSVLQAVNRTIDDLVQASASQWEQPCLELMQAETRFMARTLDALLGPSRGAEPLAPYADDQLLGRFSALREAELFGIIVDYPDSTAAIADLRVCVEHKRSMHAVALQLRANVQQRLLHPGATTGDILAQYISAIRCLRLLDPSSTMLEIVARPIRAFLRARDDTVICIVQDMVAEESELFEDLSSNMSLLADNVTYDEDGVLAWTPLPVEATFVLHSAYRRDADVLSLLVSIYDTQSVFVHEFEAHLAAQLLSRDSYDCEREIRQTEMMKLRFGESALERCEVMLRDMADSKRVWHGCVCNDSDDNDGNRYSALVVSRQFWATEPPVEQFTMPAPMGEMRDRFTGVFESLRPARTLEWRDAQSRVDVCVEIGTRTLNMCVRPSQAAVLFAFQDAPRQSLNELALVLECSEEFVLPRVRFWQSRGVVREVGELVFETVETEGHEADRECEERADRGSNTMGDNNDDDDDDDDEGEGGSAPSADARTEALRMHFNFIVGMLTNFGPLPLDRIHSMLGMFIPGDQTTVEELRAFLAQMQLVWAEEDGLSVGGGSSDGNDCEESNVGVH
ncbi:Anaphase-promoting complex subunit 2, partial [Coemansia sp. RSA 2618]